MIVFSMAENNMVGLPTSHKYGRNNAAFIAKGILLTIPPKLGSNSPISNEFPPYASTLFKSCCCLPLYWLLELACQLQTLALW